MRKKLCLNGHFDVHGNDVRATGPEPSSWDSGPQTPVQHRGSSVDFGASPVEPPLLLQDELMRVPVVAPDSLQRDVQFFGNADGALALLTHILIARGSKSDFGVWKRCGLHAHRH